MKGDRLYDVIEFILNGATEDELEVVRSALKRRIEGNRKTGAMGVDPGRIANQTAASIKEQMGLSIDQIRSMVGGFAEEIIKKNAPELTDSQVHDLLDSWIPDSKSAGSKAPEERAGEAKSAQRKGAGGLAPDVILTMVTQFLSYSDESMSVTEQVKLNREIPDWQRRYWEQFSPRIRELLTLHLRGQIERSTCLERICADLGIDADFSS